MKHYLVNTFKSVLTASFLLPAMGFSTPVTPASQPLFLEGSVKHNILLSIDDSGSMDFETLFPTNDGALWLHSDGSFVNSDGTLKDSSGSVSSGKYTYLFPNGQNGSYNGRAMLAGSHYAIPPVKPFAFARSAEYNKAYYDPAVDYTPWPSYGGYSWPDSSASAAPYDPNFTSFTLDLTQDFSTSTDKPSGESQWDFDINTSAMPCTDSGGACGKTGDEDYTYYPATYYVVDNTSTYTFTPSGNGNSNTNNSVLIEAEDAVLLGNYIKASDGAPSTNDIYQSALVSDASGGDYVGIEGVSAEYDSPPLASEGQVSLTFSVAQTGTQYIWVRRMMPGGSADSLWLNLYGHKASEFQVDSGDPWYDVNGEHWNKWWTGHTASPDWVWERWASVDINSTGTQTLRIRYREPGVYIDQIMVTTSSSATPSGAMKLSAPKTLSETRDCSTDIDPSYYKAFEADTTQFSGVDAIGPDGRCLKKVEIKSGQTTYNAGTGYSRSYDDEIQNFANWFTYYRRRHQAMRGGLAEAFQGISGVRAGMFWINNRSDVSMKDMDKASDVTSFLKDHYEHVSSGGTPLRQALKYAGDQLKRSDSGAPVTEACQKNFTLLFTDGFANASSISGINNEDGSAGQPYEDTYSSTLADIAYKYYDEKLFSASDFTLGQVKVPTACNGTNPPESLDCNTNLHMNTYTVGLGARGTIFGETHNKVIDAYNNPPTWPDVSSVRDRRQVDDLYHAAVNGRGEMFNAQSPSTLATELSAALRDIIASIGSGSSVTFNTSTLSAESLVYSTLFNSTSWTGQIQAYPLDPNSGAIASSPAWLAGDILNNSVPSNRVILTYSGDTGDGVAFHWGNLDSTAQADLNQGPSGDDGRGSDRLAYLRGDRSLEGTDFRNRGGLLGDIVHSTPVYVGDPSLGWPDKSPFGTVSDPYSNFKNNTARGRTPVVYVGSNDGMLHGFKAIEDASAGGGQEVLAYIPKSLYSDQSKQGLHYLTDPDYTHRYYVDLSPQAVDVYTAATSGGTPAWRTVLIGGLRNGGAGLFALDVTDPSSFSESNADDLLLWDFDGSDDDRLNYILDEPTVAMMNNGRWALITGNGFADGSDAADDKTGVFIIYMDGGLDGTWTEGVDYEFIEVADTGGMAQVSLYDVNQDMVVDRIYGGDREGNLWAIDVSDAQENKWESAFMASNKGPAEPLFTAVDSSGNPQPISVAPRIVRNTLSPAGEEGSNGEDYLIFFGTGQYLTSGDASSTAQQSFYGIWDRGDGQIGRSDLTEQVLTTSGDLRTTTSNSIDWSDTGGSGRQYGWYMDLSANSGERVITRAQYRGNVLFFKTFIPSSDACSGGGGSWLMSTSMDGGEPKQPVFDSDNDGDIDADDGKKAGEYRDNGGIGDSAFLTNKQYDVSSGGTGEVRDVETGSGSDRTGRLGWQELMEM
ncbi:PilC/PilY family type IV pilus protein [Marinobacteraceae bacterium S3BR75-40.1]